MAKAKIVVDFYHLTFQSGSSNKFYNVYITEDGACILRWGRIHTQGQSSVSVMSTYDDAHDLAMRQVYAKKSKGYTQQFASKHVIDAQAVRWAKEGNPDTLFSAIDQAQAEGAYTGVRDAVLTHYADLAEKAQSLMARADGLDFEQVSIEYDHLKEVWGEIEEKHAEIAVAMSIAEATFAKKLLGI